MKDDLKTIQTEYLEKIQNAELLQDIDALFIELFGKSGKIALLPKEFSKLSKDELKAIGPLFNQVKAELEQAISDKRQSLKEKFYESLKDEEFNLDEEAEIKERTGYTHPISSFSQEIVDLFSKLGFQLYSAPHIDSDLYNFELLNIPPEHPARDLWDTMYVNAKDEKNDNMLLRTHTSNSQVRIMKEIKPPFRMMILDRCFRYENLDARHEHTFDQFEIVFVDKGLSMANLQYLSEYFLKAVLGEEIKVRLKPKYYPFVEPGVGIDGLCLFCKGEGCKVCGEGWLELGGAGMIHPQVLKNGGIDPEVYSGIAWGPGLERILMLKKNVNDLRLFRSGDLKFLQEINK